MNEIDSDYDRTLEDGEYETFSLDCQKAEGNMIYITDEEIQTRQTGHQLAHGFSEVFVISAEPGKYWYVYNYCKYRVGTYLQESI